MPCPFRSMVALGIAAALVVCLCADRGHGSASRDGGISTPRSTPVIAATARCTDCHSPTPGLDEMAEAVSFEHLHDPAHDCSACHQVPETGNWPWDLYTPKQVTPPIKGDPVSGIDSLREQLQHTREQLQRALQRIADLERKLADKGRRKNG